MPGIRFLTLHTLLYRCIPGIYVIRYPRTPPLFSHLHFGECFFRLDHGRDFGHNARSRRTARPRANTRAEANARSAHIAGIAAKLPRDRTRNARTFAATQVRYYWCETYSGSQHVLGDLYERRRDNGSATDDERPKRSILCSPPSYSKSVV